MKKVEYEEKIENILKDKPTNKLNFRTIPEVLAKLSVIAKKHGRSSNKELEMLVLDLIDKFEKTLESDKI